MRCKSTKNMGINKNCAFASFSLLMFHIIRLHLQPKTVSVGRPSFRIKGNTVRIRNSTRCCDLHAPPDISHIIRGQCFEQYFCHWSNLFFLRSLHRPGRRSKRELVRRPAGFWYDFLLSGVIAK